MSVVDGLIDLARCLEEGEGAPPGQELQAACVRSLSWLAADGVALWNARGGQLEFAAGAGLGLECRIHRIDAGTRQGSGEAPVLTTAGPRLEGYRRRAGVGVPLGAVLDVPMHRRGVHLGTLWWFWGPMRGILRDVERRGVLLGTTFAMALTSARDRQVLAKLIHEEDAQRDRLAAALHDEIGQDLIVLLMAARREAETHGAPAGGEFAREVERIVERVRELAYRMRPPTLGTLGLVASLRWLTESLARSSGRSIRLVLLIESRLPETVEACLYRVVQEALSNAIRHAEASEIAVVLEEAAGNVIVRVIDDGHGFHMDAALGTGLGIVTMRERLTELGADFRIVSAVGSGTTVEARIPNAKANRADNSRPAGGRS